MADFKAMSIMTFVTLAVINIGIISFQMSDTGINLFGSDTNSTYLGLNENLTYASFAQKLVDTYPVDADTNITCNSLFGCGTAWVVNTTTDLVGGASTVVDTAVFVFQLFFIAAFGFPTLLNIVATMIEGEILGPIHMLFGIISLVVAVIALMGLVNFIIEVKNAMKL